MNADLTPAERSRLAELQPAVEGLQQQLAAAHKASTQVRSRLGPAAAAHS